MAAAGAVLLDDHLLIDELLVGLHLGRHRPHLYTTSYCYYRAAVAGAGSHFSGPFDLPREEQERPILSLLELRDDMSLPNPRVTVPAMADLSRRHAQLTLLNLEAAGAALTLSARRVVVKRPVVRRAARMLDAESVPGGPWTWPLHSDDVPHSRAGDGNRTPVLSPGSDYAQT